MLTLTGYLPVVSRKPIAPSTPAKAKRKQPEQGVKRIPVGQGMTVVKIPLSTKRTADLAPPRQPVSAWEEKTDLTDDDDDGEAADLDDVRTPDPEPAAKRVKNDHRRNVTRGGLPVQQYMVDPETPAVALRALPVPALLATDGLGVAVALVAFLDTNQADALAALPDMFDVSAFGTAVALFTAHHGQAPRDEQVVSGLARTAFQWCATGTSSAVHAQLALLGEHTGALLPRTTEFLGTMLPLHGAVRAYRNTLLNGGSLHDWRVVLAGSGIGSGIGSGPMAYGPYAEYWNRLVETTRFAGTEVNPWPATADAVKRQYPQSVHGRVLMQLLQQRTVDLPAALGAVTDALQTEWTTGCEVPCDAAQALALVAWTVLDPTASAEQTEAALRWVARWVPLHRQADWQSAATLLALASARTDVVSSMMQLGWWTDRIVPGAAQAALQEAVRCPLGLDLPQLLFGQSDTTTWTTSAHVLCSVLDYRPALYASTVAIGQMLHRQHRWLESARDGNGHSPTEALLQAYLNAPIARPFSVESARRCAEFRWPLHQSPSELPLAVWRRLLPGVPLLHIHGLHRSATAEETAAWAFALSDSEEYTAQQVLAVCQEQLRQSRALPTHHSLPDAAEVTDALVQTADRVSGAGPALHPALRSQFHLQSWVTLNQVAQRLQDTLRDRMSYTDWVTQSRRARATYALPYGSHGDVQEAEWRCWRALGAYAAAHRTCCFSSSSRAQAAFATSPCVRVLMAAGRVPSADAEDGNAEQSAAEGSEARWNVLPTELAVAATAWWTHAALARQYDDIKAALRSGAPDVIPARWHPANALRPLSDWEKAKAGAEVSRVDSKEEEGGESTDGDRLSAVSKTDGADATHVLEWYLDVSADHTPRSVAFLARLMTVCPTPASLYALRTTVQCLLHRYTIRPHWNRPAVLGQLMAAALHCNVWLDQQDAVERMHSVLQTTLPAHQNHALSVLLHACEVCDTLSNQTTYLLKMMEDTAELSLQ